MKKQIKRIMAMIMACVCLVGCGNSTPKQANQDKKKIKVVTTIFPAYDWVKHILGDTNDEVELTMLLDNGVDLHSYQPTAEDMVKISDCDLFIYVGGESDHWVKDALQEAKNKNRVTINLMETLGNSVKEEELVEGMQEEEHDHEHEEDDHEHGEEHNHEEEVEYDEHVWLSLKNAENFVKKIAEAMQTIDQQHSEDYKKNSESYLTKLNELDEKFKEAVNQGNKHTLVFGDRFPFRYFVDDYGLDYYAAFVGCSAETEASFETIKFLAEKVDELSLSSVMTIEGKEHKIAETIVRNTKNKNQQILTLDSMQATTSKDVEKGTTYLSIMENNLSILKEALK